MGVDENGTVTLSEDRALARATPVEDLFLLSEIDATMAELARRMKKNKEDLEVYGLEVEREKKELEAARHSLKEHQRIVAKEEGELEAIVERRKVLDAKIMRISSPKELTAVQDEMGKLDGEIAEREEKVLLLYDEQEKAEAALKGLEDQAEKIGAAVIKQSAEKKNENSRMALRRTELEEMRGEYLVRLDPGLSSRYEKAMEEHGEPVAFAILDNGCGGCGWAASASEFQKFRKNAYKPYDCPHCHRLLVWVGAPES